MGDGWQVLVGFYTVFGFDPGCPRPGSCCYEGPLRTHSTQPGTVSPVLAFMFFGRKSRPVHVITWGLITSKRHLFFVETRERHTQRRTIDERSHDINTIKAREGGIPPGNTIVEGMDVIVDVLSHQQMALAVEAAI